MNGNLTDAGWRAPWSAEQPVPIDFAFSPVDGPWRHDAETGLAIRDLGLAAASDGNLGARHIRVDDPAKASARGWLRHDLDFQFIYTLSGSGLLENERGDKVPLARDTVAVQGPLLRHRFSGLSADFGMIEITVPAEAYPDAVADAGPSIARQARAGDRAPIYLQETPDSFVTGAGPRRYFAYRDLLTTDFSERRLHIHVVKALGRMDGGTGWHTHTMSQIFVVLDGWADLQVEGRKDRRMAAGDAMCLRAGMGHNVPDFSADYKVLELCLPADYDTSAAEPPR